MGGMPLSAYSQRAKTSLQTKALDQSPPLVHLQTFPGHFRAA